MPLLKRVLNCLVNSVLHRKSAIYVCAFDLECDDPSPINGLASLPSGKTYDNTAVISCNDGYKLVGNELIVCIDGPKWSSSPTCVKGM